MSDLEDVLPDLGRSADQPQSGSIRISGNAASAMAAFAAGILQLFGIDFDGTYLSLGAIPNLPGPPYVLVSTLSAPLIQCAGPEVIPTVPSFAELDGSRRDFKGFVARLLMAVINYITVGLPQNEDTHPQLDLRRPNYREHIYGFVAAHLHFAMTALRQLGLPCSLIAFTSILDGYVQGVMTGRNHENTFRDTYDRHAHRLYTPLLATAIVGNGVQAVNDARLELQGAIEILSYASTRRALTDGHVTNRFAVDHYPGFEDGPGTQAFTYHGNRYWLSDAELDALAALNPEPKPSTPNYQPMQGFPIELLRDIGRHLPTSSRLRARFACRDWNHQLR